MSTRSGRRPESGRAGERAGDRGAPTGADDAVFAALADPTRRRLLDLLADHGAATATALAAELPVSRQAVVKHLAALSRAGLVSAERSGREVRYVVRPERLSATARRMAAVAATWESRLAAIRRIAESDQPLSSGTVAPR